MPSKKSLASYSILAIAAKRWNKFFYRSPKGTIDPDSEWKQQNEQHKKNEVYKLVNFSGGGSLIEEYDKGKTEEEKKLRVQQYFEEFVAPDCLHETAEAVTVEDYENWRKRQSHVATKLMRRKERQAMQRSVRTTTAIQVDAEKDFDRISIATLDSVVKPYQEHKVKWKLDRRGAIGETPVHLLFLNGSDKHIDIAEALFESFPELAMDLYEGYEYYGESCLHFAIIQENLKAVKILLQTGKVDLHSRARGKFFIPVDIKRGDVKLRKHRFEGYAYYGEYPLSFAASIGNDEIYDVLIKSGCDPNQVDRYGNGVLHLTVIHNQPEMYQHALLHVDNKKRPDPNLCNNNGLTPLALAAKLGKIEMFEKILKTSSKRFWSYHTVTCSAYPLKSFDTIGPNGETDWNSALMMIVRGKKNSHLNLVSNHVVHQLLEEKWKKFGHDKFIRLLAAYVIHLLFLSVAVYLRPDVNSDLRYGTSSYDVARYVFECLVICICLFVLGFAVKEIYLESISGYWQNLLAIPSRMFYLIAVLLLLLCIPMRFTELYAVEEWFLVFAVPGLWSYMLFFLRNHSSTGPFITIIFRIFRTDLIRFAVIYAIVLFACALAFFYQFEGRNTPAFLTELGTMMTLFQMSFGEFDSDVVLQGKYQALTIIMFVFFMIIVHILLLNMLIAMITRTFEKITKQSEKVWRRQWAAMVVTMERSHSKQEKIAFQRSYDLNIDSKRVTAEGDAATSDSYAQTGNDRRALMVVHHQEQSETQRKGKLKQLIKQKMSFSKKKVFPKQKSPTPSFQVKSVAGLSDLIRDAPRHDEEDLHPKTISRLDTLNYSDSEEDE